LDNVGAFKLLLIFTYLAAVDPGGGGTVILAGSQSAGHASCESSFWGTVGVPGVKDIELPRPLKGSGHVITPDLYNYISSVLYALTANAQTVGQVAEKERDRRAGLGKKHASEPITEAQLDSGRDGEVDVAAESPASEDDIPADNASDLSWALDDALESVDADPWPELYDHYQMAFRTRSRRWARPKFSIIIATRVPSRLRDPASLGGTEPLIAPRCWSKSHRRSAPLRISRRPATITPAVFGSHPGERGFSSGSCVTLRPSGRARRSPHQYE